jgi:receptor expression-enhancing protein 1/2/3/4
VLFFIQGTRRTRRSANALLLRRTSSAGSCIGLSLAASSGSSTSQNGLSHGTTTPFFPAHSWDIESHRIPLYFTFKTLFLLYLALPQTQGSSYLYVNHLQPFFHSHETQIDATLASLKAKVYSFVQDRLRAVWDHIAASIGQSQPQAGFSPVGGSSNTNTGAPPTMGDPASGPAQLVSSLWQSYGPSIIASGAALLRQSAPPPGGRPALNTPLQSNSRNVSGSSTSLHAQEVAERRRQLEAELSALPKDLGVPTVLMPGAGSSSRINPSRTSSSSDIRERTNSGTGRFEEIEVPSDAEGYDVGDTYTGEGESSSGYGTGGPDAQKRPGSWFGWGVGSSKGAYERVKSE